MLARDRNSSHSTDMLSMAADMSADMLSMADPPMAWGSLDTVAARAGLKALFLE